MPRHAPLYLVIAGFTVAGGLLGAWLLAGSWSMLRAVLGGGVMGAWCGFLLTARRLLM